MMRSHWILVVLLAFPASRAAAEVWECLDESGVKRFTNRESEAKEWKNCKSLNVGPVVGPTQEEREKRAKARARIEAKLAAKYALERKASVVSNK